MKKLCLTLLLTFTVIALFPSSVFAQTPTPPSAPNLRSNLKDPGISQNAWSYYPDQTCFSGYPLWSFNSVSASGTPCSGNVMGQRWDYVNGRYEVTLSLDNTANTANMCNSDRVYYGLQGFPWGYKNLLYFKDLSALKARVTIKNNSLTSACDDPNNPICLQHACPRDNWGNTLGWLAILIGVPMYDETNKRNLWLEISPYWTKNARYGGPQNDPNSNSYLFWGESRIEELHRIMITHPLVNKPIVNPGETVSYDLDLLPLLKSLTWGRTYSIDWNKVHLADLYLGVETWGWTLTNFTLSNLDFLYDVPTPTVTPTPSPTSTLTPTPSPLAGDFNADGKVDILDLRQLLINFTSIFDYNILVGNFGR